MGVRGIGGIALVACNDKSRVQDKSAAQQQLTYLVGTNRLLQLEDMDAL